MKNKSKYVLISLLVLVSIFSVITYLEKEDLKKTNARITILEKSQTERIEVLEKQILEMDGVSNTLKLENQSLSSKYDSLLVRFNALETGNVVEVKYGENLNELIEENALPMYTKVANLYPTKVFTFRYGDFGFSTITTDYDYKIVSFNRLEQLMDYHNSEGS